MSVRRRTGWDVGRWSIPAGLVEASFARAAVLQAREAREVDGVRGLIVFDSGTIQTLNRSGIRRDWLRGDEFEAGLRRLAAKLPILWDGTVLDGELTTGRFATTMAALIGSKAHRADLRFVAFDLPVLAGVDLRKMPWHDRRDRLELLAQAFEEPLELSPIVEPRVALVEAMQDGRLEGIVLKDRLSTFAGPTISEAPGGVV